MGCKTNLNILFLVTCRKNYSESLSIRLFSLQQSSANIMSSLPKIEWNFLQSLSISGLALSLLSQAGLLLINKSIEHFERVYYVWAVVFVLGCILQWLFAKGYITSSIDDHHHDHTH